ncbi:MAG: SUMF1/EgtB/PvdO family nonheme iron enzyme [Spirochaetaceae bacterium]|nr:SUMF1/EgtB/PvdO family nonheme iron enzyme [Spirochaetaceae bacterium]
MKQNKKKNIKHQDPENELIAERVRLRPVAGIQPRVYVTALYALGLAGIFFFVFLYPGLVYPGSEITFTSLPEEASVLVDGKRIGATPLTAFIAEGRHVITFRRPHFEETKLPFVAGSRTFASRFFPLQESLHAELPLRSPDGLLEEAHREFSVWASSGEPGSSAVPPVLAAAARDYALSGKAEDAEEKLFALLSQAAASVNSPAGFRDFIEAVLLAASGGKALSPQSFIKAAEWFLCLYAHNPEALYWLILVLPDGAREEFLAAPQTQAFLKEAASRQPQMPTGRIQGFVTISGAQYAALTPGEFLAGAFYPSNMFSRLGPSGGQQGYDAALRRLRENPPFTRAALVESAFYLCTREVTQADYAAFLRENPSWLPENRAALVKQGLAEDAYLASWKESSAAPQPQDPVNEVSFYAAAAYCEWLNGKAGRYEFFLPTETQWEYGRTLLSPDGETSGGLWEWCAGWYAPAAYIFPQAGDLPAAEKVVRGGTSLNTRGTVTASTRASQPPQWCSPYLGFRVAARERG